LYIIELEIKNFLNLKDSIDSYFREELLDNSNAVLCEKCNKKYNCFKNIGLLKLPRILVLLLKRFEYDYIKKDYYKIDNYFEFPFELNLDKYT